jgi:hypothetical protein
MMAEDEQQQQNEATWGERRRVLCQFSPPSIARVVLAALFLLSSSRSHVLFILCSPSLIIWRHSSFPRLFLPFISFPFFLITIIVIVISWSNGMISERRHTIPFTHTPALTADGWGKDADWQVSLMLKQVHAASEIPGYSWGSKFVSHFTIRENCPLAVHSFILLLWLNSLFMHSYPECASMNKSSFLRVRPTILPNTLSKHCQQLHCRTRPL